MPEGTLAQLPDGRTVMYLAGDLPAGWYDMAGAFVGAELPTGAVTFDGGGMDFSTEGDAGSGDQVNLPRPDWLPGFIPWPILTPQTTNPFTGDTEGGAFDFANFARLAAIYQPEAASPGQVREFDGNLVQVSPDGTVTTLLQGTPEAVVQERPTIPAAFEQGPDGQTYIRQPDGSLQRVTPPPTPPEPRIPSVDDLIAQAFIDGDLGTAQQLFDFKTQPTQMERLQTAIQVAQSPADYLTVVGMMRGEIPQDPFNYRIGPPAQTFGAFMSPQVREAAQRREMATAEARGFQNGQQASQTMFNGTPVPASTTDPGAQALRAQGVPGIPAATSGPFSFTGQNFSSLLPPGAGFAPAKGPIVTQQQLGAGFEGEHPDLVAGPSGLRAIRQRERDAAVGSDAGLPPIGARRTVPQTFGPQSQTTFDPTTGRNDKPATPPPAGEEWVYNGTSWVSIPTSQPGISGTRSTAPGATGSTEIRPGVRFGSGGGNLMFGQTPQQRAAGNTFGLPSFLSEAVGGDILSRGAISSPRRQIGPIPFRSAQTVRNQAPEERALFEAAVQLTGRNPAAFKEQEERATTIGSPRRRRAFFG